MITGEIKNRIDAIWDTFWTGGITAHETMPANCPKVTFFYKCSLFQSSRKIKIIILSFTSCSIREKIGQLLFIETGH